MLVADVLVQTTTVQIFLLADIALLEISLLRRQVHLDVLLKVGAR